MAKRRNPVSAHPMAKTDISVRQANCVLVGFKMVSGLRDADIIEACERHGFADNGMFRYKWAVAAQELGLELTELGLDEIRMETKAGEWWNARHVTVDAFCKRFKLGTFLVSIAHHLLVVHDGIVKDPNNAYRRKGRSRVQSACRVLNSVLPPKPKRYGKNPTLRLVRGSSVYRYGTKHYGIFRAIEQVTNNLGRNRFTFEQAEAVGYTRHLLAYDIRRGNVEIVND